VRRAAWQVLFHTQHIARGGPPHKLQRIDHIQRSHGQLIFPGLYQQPESSSDWPHREDVLVRGMSEAVPPFLFKPRNKADKPINRRQRHKYAIAVDATCQVCKKIYGLPRHFQSLLSSRF
jgi:hypothetical protein